MKAIAADGGLTLTVETPQVPLLALDTNVLIEAGRGLANPGSGDPRVVGFLNAARKKVDEGKLLCFETNQREEYLGSPDSRSITTASASLTRGLRSHTSEIVYNNELAVGMRGFLAGETNLSIPLTARFDLNPDEIARSPRGSFHRSSAGLLAPVAMVSRAMKTTDVSALTEVKKSYSGMSYEQARHRELRALALRFEAPMIAADVAAYVGLWESSGGRDSDGFKRFLDSPYCMNVPKSEIEAEIFADVMVSPLPIESGDLHDVGHLSIALPVARFVLTDARMRDRLRRLKLDQRWSVNVFSIKTLGDLVRTIEKL
jgi:hypothetical protein